MADIDPERTFLKKPRAHLFCIEAFNLITIRTSHLQGELRKHG